MARCTQCSGESEAYVHFIDPHNANQPGADWQFRENIILETTPYGDVVLDVLQDGRIGGVEFLTRL